jgi:hypothetical protein
MNALQRLQDWYSAQCNGDWEHNQGVRIESLDNPGWALDIDLADTALADKPFTEVKRGYEDTTDWLICFLRDGKFMGRCGPQRLQEMIKVFVTWAEES